MEKRKNVFVLLLVAIVFFTSLPLSVLADGIDLSEERQAKTPEDLGYKFNAETGCIEKYIGNEADIQIPEYFLVNGEEVPVTEIGAEAFRAERGKTKIKSIKLPSGLRKIGNTAFYENELEEIILPEGLEEIGTIAFQDNKLKKLKLPQNLKVIENSAFSGNKLTEVILNEGLEEIGERAFQFNQLKKLEIPSTVVNICEGVVEYNRDFEEVIIDNKKGNVNVHDGAFNENVKVTYLGDQESKNVVPDPVLREIINHILDREADTPVTKNDLAGIEEIYPRWVDDDEMWKLKSLEGLQYAENLVSLQLSGVNVTDLMPLQNLRNLTNLHILGDYRGDNPKLKGQKSELKDITPIGKMEQLTYLRIIGTQLEDITPISNLKKLENLHLERNEISDVSPLKDVPVTQQLFLQGNCIADFTPIHTKEALKNSNEGQRIKVTPDTVEFDNPHIRLWGWPDTKLTYMKVKENNYIVNTGDKGEKLKVIKAPESGNIIEVEYEGSKYNPNKLIVDISNIKDQIGGSGTTLAKQKVYFDVYGKQEDTMIGTIYNPNVQVWNDKGEELTNENNLSYMWELPDGKYTYKAFHPDYKDEEGEFEVKGEAVKIEVTLSYDLEKPGNYAYPTIESLEILDRATKRVLGKGTFDGQIISIVIEDPKDRELVYNGRAMIKAETKNAVSYMCKTEASPSSPKFTESSGSINRLNGENSSWSHPFKKDSITYMLLKGKGGLENHYGIVIKEKENQHAIIFMSSADKDTSLGSLKIPTGNFEGREVWEVFRFVQLVDHGEKAIEPLKYIKDTYDKNARLFYKGGKFEGWYYNRDWVKEFSFDNPIVKDMEIHAKFSNSSNINKFPDPFIVWTCGPRRDALNPQFKTYSRFFHEKDGEWIEYYHGAENIKVDKVGDELRFKIDIVDDKYDLAYLYVKHGGRKLPITQHEDGSFSFVPGPSQDSEMFRENIIYYDLIKKDKKENSFDINKQHHINLLSEGPDLVCEYLKDTRYFTMGQEGNTIRLRIKGYNIDDVSVTTNSGKNIEIKQIGDEEIADNGVKTRYYEFTMPNEDVDINTKGSYYSPIENRFLTFKVKDENGNEIDPSKVEKLVVSTDPYEYIIEDITEPKEIVARASGRSYHYILSVADYDTFYGEFWLDKDSPDEVVLIIDTSKEDKKTKEDVERLVDIAKSHLKEKDKYSTKSIENLESAIKNAEHVIKLQSHYDYAFFKLTSAIDGLEELKQPEPSIPTEPTKPGKPVEPKPTEKPEPKPEKPIPEKSKEPIKEKPIEVEILANLKTEKKIKTETGEIKIAPKSFDENIGKVKFIAKEEDSAIEIKVVDEKEKPVEIKKALEVKVKFEGKVKNKDNVTVILIKEDGTKEPVGGVYDEKTKTIKFLTNECGKFIVEEGKKEFKDTLNVEWAKAAIESMAVKGIIKGKPENKFDPNANISRAEFATLASRILKLNEKSNKQVPFKDVDKDVWYYDSVAAVYENDIINGKPGNVFDPTGEITREEIVKIIGAILKEKGYENKDMSKLNKFKDSNSVSSWAKEEAALVVENGIIAGNGKGEFMPKVKATRAEVATMLYRLYNLILK